MDNMTKKAVWKVICALLALMLVMALAATAVLLLWPLGDSGSSGLKRTEAVLQAEQPKEAETRTKTQIQITGAEPAEDTEDEIAADGDYIISSSGTKVLKDADIEGMSAKELNYARNEIFARHGRKFDSKELRDYFESKSWYKGEYSAEEFDEKSDSVLNEVEKKMYSFWKRRRKSWSRADISWISRRMKCTEKCTEV